jgi:hypothetical protein
LFRAHHWTPRPKEGSFFRLGFDTKVDLTWGFEWLDKTGCQNRIIHPLAKLEIYGLEIMHLQVGKYR